MIVVATSDVHSPRYLFQYVAALSKHSELCREAGVVLWAGDMVERGRVEALLPVVEATRKKCPSARIVSVFGNEEYMDREIYFIKRYPHVVWLNDSYIVVDGKDKSIAIYGSRGVLDRPTRWQRRNIPGIDAVYKRRAEKTAAMLKQLREKADVVVLVTHYAPSYLTLEGENPKIWPELGSKTMEKILLDAKPDMAVHGHAHRSKRLEASINGTRIVNVAFPARGDIVVMEL